MVWKMDEIMELSLSFVCCSNFLIEAIVTCKSIRNLDWMLWYLVEVHRALTGVERDFSACTSLQRLWMSRSRRILSLRKSNSGSSEGPKYHETVDMIKLKVQI